MGKVSSKEITHRTWSCLAGAYGKSIDVPLDEVIELLLKKLNVEVFYLPESTTTTPATYRLIKREK